MLSARWSLADLRIPFRPWFAPSPSKKKPHPSQFTVGTAQLLPRTSIFASHRPAHLPILGFIFTLFIQPQGLMTIARHTAYCKGSPSFMTLHFSIPSSSFAHSSRRFDGFMKSSRRLVPKKNFERRIPNSVARGSQLALVCKDATWNSWSTTCRLGSASSQIQANVICISSLISTILCFHADHHSPLFGKERTQGHTRMAFRASLSFILALSVRASYLVEACLGACRGLLGLRLLIGESRLFYGGDIWSEALVLLNQVSPKALWMWSGLNGRKSE